MGPDKILFWPFFVLGQGCPRQVRGKPLTLNKNKQTVKEEERKATSSVPKSSQFSSLFPSFLFGGRLDYSTDSTKAQPEAFLHKPFSSFGLQDERKTRIEDEDTGT